MAFTMTMETAGGWIPKLKPKWRSVEIMLDVLVRVFDPRD